LSSLLKLVFTHIDVKKIDFVLETTCCPFKEGPNLSATETHVRVKENKSRQVLVCLAFLKFDEFICVKSYDFIFVELVLRVWVMIKLGLQLTLKVQFGKFYDLIRLHAFLVFSGHAEPFSHAVVVSR